MAEIMYNDMLMKATRAYMRDFAKKYRAVCPDEAEVKKMTKMEREYINLMLTLVEGGVDKGKPFLMTQIKSESNAGRFIKTYVNDKYKDVRVWNSIHGTVKIMSR